jgi:hypothetical protein
VSHRVGGGDSFAALQCDDAPEPWADARRYVRMRVTGDVMKDLAALPAHEQAKVYREAAREAEYFGRANDAIGAHYRSLAERWQRLADDLELDRPRPSTAAMAHSESAAALRT